MTPAASADAPAINPKVSFRKWRRSITFLLASDATVSPRRDERWLNPLVSRRAKFLGQDEHLAGAGNAGPVAIEVGNQPLHFLAAGGAVERGLVRELIGRLMHGRVRDAPEPPRLLRTEGFHGVGHVFGGVPSVERRAPGGIGDGG